MATLRLDIEHRSARQTRAINYFSRGHERLRRIGCIGEQSVAKRKDTGPPACAIFPGMGTAAVQTHPSLASKPDEATLVEIVERAMHASASEWLFFRELRVGTGRH